MGREGFREGLTIVAASVAAFAAGAAGLSLVRGSEGWESTAVVRQAPAGEPLRSAAVARRALDAAGARGERAGELLDHLSAARSGGAAEFTVRAEEPAAARRLAGSYARAWAADVRPSSFSGPSTPVRTDRDTARAALIGAAIGLLAGLLLAFLRELLDVRRTSSRNVAAGLGLAELGRVPEVGQGVEDAYRLPALESTDRFAVKANERLAARVAGAARAKSARVVAVRGTVAEDRGEQVAAGLAAALASEGRRVAIVELDPSRPTLRRQFALARREGAAEVCRGEATLDEALAPVQGLGGLSVLTAGAGTALESDTADDLLGALRKRFDMVVVAAPPLLAGARRADGRTSAGGRALAGVDALVLAVALRRTRRSRRPRLERVLAGLDVPVLGFVLMASAGENRPGAQVGSVQRAPDLAAGGHQARHHDRQQYQ
jgi:succinoglycan biosynthesis transport protein ExoP